MLRICFFIVLIFLYSSEESGHYKKSRMPKIMGDKIPLNILKPERAKTRQKIVKIHNLLRTKVKPTASNMLRMKWNEQIARSAEKWTENCKFLTHDDNFGRFIPNYGPCGQNIFVATQKVPWMFAIKTWYLEKENFTYGGKNDLGKIGHYTQMVWAASHEIGCGISKCLNKINGTIFKYYSYICNYCPIGNLPNKLSFPYKKGKVCNDCPGQCFAGKLCTNSCPSADFWSNCKKLYKRWPKWLCFSKTEKGKERFRKCKATCTCTNKIFD